MIRWYITILAACAVASLNGYGLGLKHGNDRVDAYVSQEVTLGPPEHPNCTHTTTVGTLVEALLNEGTYGHVGWLHDHIRWMYTCGYVMDDKERRGVMPHCDDEGDRCA